MRVHHLGVLTVLAGCTQILGVPAEDETKDVGSIFCACDEVAKNFPDCANTVTALLNGASADERAEWLQSFGGNQCTECANAETAACMAKAPVCFGEGEACVSREACCGQKPNGPTCLPVLDANTSIVGHECAACSEYLNVCNDSADCCDLDATCEKLVGTEISLCFKPCDPRTPECENGCCLGSGQNGPLGFGEGPIQLDGGICFPAGACEGGNPPCSFAEDESQPCEASGRCTPTCPQGQRCVEACECNSDNQTYEQVSDCSAEARDSECGILLCVSL